MSDHGRAHQPTPLHARTAELCTTNAWVEECGFTVPALYTSAREEQEALTRRVALSDLSSRQSWLIEGAEAAAFLSFATLADAARIEPGQTARALWCDDQGHVRGEGLIARFGANVFELSTAVRDFAWMADGVRGFDVKLVNASGSRAIIGVRGPRAQALLVAAGLAAGGSVSGGAGAPQAFRPAQVALIKDPLGDGIELWMEAEDGVVVWDRLWRSGASFGVAAAGALTLETARIENAIPRAGVDWLPAHLVRDAAELRTPLDLGFAVDTTRRFNGADALRAPRTTKPQALVQLVSEEVFARGPVTARNTIVGRITSAAWSESRACGVALAWLEADAAKVGARVSAAGPLGPVQAEVAREGLRHGA